MSVKNLYLLDPEFRRKHSRGTSSNGIDAKFPHRLARNRRNKRATKPYWDVHWRGAISKAIKELNVAHTYINDGVFFKTVEAKSSVQNRATEIWTEIQSRF